MTLYWRWLNKCPCFTLVSYFHWQQIRLWLRCLLIQTAALVSQVQQSIATRHLVDWCSIPLSLHSDPCCGQADRWSFKLPVSPWTVCHMSADKYHENNSNILSLWRILLHKILIWISQSLSSSTGRSQKRVRDREGEGENHSCTFILAVWKAWHLFILKYTSSSKTPRLSNYGTDRVHPFIREKKTTKLVSPSNEQLKQPWTSHFRRLFTHLFSHCFGFDWCTIHLWEPMTRAEVHPSPLWVSCRVCSFSVLCWGFELIASETFWHLHNRKWTSSGTQAARLSPATWSQRQTSETLSMWNWKRLHCKMWLWLMGGLDDVHDHVRHSLGQRHTTSLPNQLFVVQHWRIPLQV